MVINVRSNDRCNIINEVEVNIKQRCTDLDVSSNTGKNKHIITNH